MSRLLDSLALDSRRAWLGGVCAGIARRFDLEPNWLRLGVLALGLCFTTLTLALYAAAWLVLEQR